MVAVSEAFLKVASTGLDLAFRLLVPRHGADEDEELPVCEADNEYDGRMGLRISAVFVIMVGGAIGVFFPVLSSRYLAIRMPWWCFFIAKFFGSGVIVATAFMHLLEPATDSLGNPCLGGVLAEYPWAFAICLMSLFAMFFMELCIFRYIDIKIAGEHDFAEGGHTHSHFGNKDLFIKEDDSLDKGADLVLVHSRQEAQLKYPSHYSHADHHQDPEVIGTPLALQEREQYYAQLVAILMLEFGILFHSVFIGLALDVAGDEFVTLYIVLIFHQMFEGFGLGSRIATTNWGKHKWTPWLFCIAFSLVMPVAIAIGLGVRNSYAPGSRTALIVNGVFDALSAGILIYTGLIELMAHEFLYSGEFKGPGGAKKMLWAFFVMCWGAGLMSVLARWA